MSSKHACAGNRPLIVFERRSFSGPIVQALHAWLEAQLPRVAGRSTLAEAIRYALSRWECLTRFLHDGRIELDTNPVERAIRPVALGRKNHLFAGSDGGGDRWAIVCSLIETALCRARHRAVYAARRTMPSWVVFPRFLAERRLIGSA
jgi:transposase